MAQSRSPPGGQPALPGPSHLGQHEVEEGPDLRRRQVARRMVDVERKIFAVPVGEEVDERSVAEQSAEPERHGLRDTEAGHAGRHRGGARSRSTREPADRAQDDDPRDAVRQGSCQVFLGQVLPKAGRANAPHPRSPLLTRFAHRAGLRLLRAVRQHPVGPDEVAGVAARVALQIILMLGFGLPERSGGGDLGDHLARPQF